MQLNSRKYRTAKKTEIAERRAKVAHMYLVERMTMQRIADALGTSIFTVSEDLAALRAGWKREARLAVEEHIAVELKKLQQLEDEARAAYELSRKPKRIATAAKRSGMDGDSTVASATTVERAEGDPRFLAEIRRCVEARMKLLGLSGQPDADQEKKKAVTTLEDLILAYEGGDATLEIVPAKRSTSVRPNQVPRSSKTEPVDNAKTERETTPAEAPEGGCNPG